MDGTAYNNRNKGSDYNNDIYYEDHFNELPWKFSFGTSQEDGVWMNTSDGSGIIMASMVWIMICKLHNIVCTKMFDCFVSIADRNLDHLTYVMYILHVIKQCILDLL